MTIQERLHTIPEEVRQAFSESFIFLVTADKFQHYPARNWSTEEVRASLTERLGADYQLKEWEQYVIAVNKAEDMCAVLPRFQHVTDLKGC